MQILVGRAGRVAFLDLFVGPVLAAGRAGRLGVELAVFGPRHGETGVEDATGVERRRRCVDHRQRRDRREVRRPKLSGEELADAAVGDAEHSDFVVEHPRLAGDRLDHVVRVEILQRFEIVERAARTAGPAHVHVDDRETHLVGHRGDSAFRAGGIRVAVSRVFDQRRSRAFVLRRREGRRMDVDRQLGAVARRQVGVAAARDRLFVGAFVPRRRLCVWTVIGPDSSLDELRRTR